MNIFSSAYFCAMKTFLVKFLDEKSFLISQDYHNINFSKLKIIDGVKKGIIFPEDKRKSLNYWEKFARRNSA
jgi:hypothetical protein